MGKMRTGTGKLAGLKRRVAVLEYQVWILMKELDLDDEPMPMPAAVPIPEIRKPRIGDVVKCKIGPDKVMDARVYAIDEWDEAAAEMQIGVDWEDRWGRHGVTASHVKLCNPLSPIPLAGGIWWWPDEGVPNDLAWNPPK